MTDSICNSDDMPAAKCAIVEHPGVYFDDLTTGERFECGSFAFTESEIIAFARKYDPQLFHVDPVAAKKGFAGALSASGIHTYAATMSVFSRSVKKLKLVAGVKLRAVEMLGPVLVDMPLRVIGTWVEKRDSKSKPGIGILTWEAEAVAEDGKPILRCGATVLVKRRDSEG